jgi:hypothetical protein
VTGWDGSSGYSFYSQSIWEKVLNVTKMMSQNSLAQEKHEVILT